MPSNTSSTTAPKPNRQRRAKLPRLLLDGDVPAPTQRLIQAVGFSVVIARHIPSIDIQSDVSVVRYARKHRLVVICFDKHRDRKTNQDLYPELHRRGGKIVKIGGNPSQHPLTALGKLLFHRDAWMEWFKTNNGRFVCTGQEARRETAAELYLRIQPQLRAPGRHANFGRPKRVKPVPAGQQVLDA